MGFTTTSPCSQHCRELRPRTLADQRHHQISSPLCYHGRENDPTTHYYTWQTWCLQGLTSLGLPGQLLEMFWSTPPMTLWYPNGPEGPGNGVVALSRKLRPSGRIRALTPTYGAGLTGHPQMAHPPFQRGKLTYFSFQTQRSGFLSTGNGTRPTLKQHGRDGGNCYGV